MLSPDTAWIVQDRWEALSEEQQDSFPPLCPDFVIQDLSASDSRPVLRARMQVWLANGAQLAWLIDPRAGEVTIYRQGGAPSFMPRSSAVAIAGF